MKDAKISYVSTDQKEVAAKIIELSKSVPPIRIEIGRKKMFGWKKYIWIENNFIYSFWSRNTLDEIQEAEKYTF